MIPTSRRSVHSLYADLKNLIDSAPDLERCDLHAPEVQRWLGRAYVTINSADESVEALTFKVYADNLDNLALRASNSQKMKATLYRVIAKVEDQIPTQSDDAFIAPGDVWGAFVQISKIFESAKSDVFVVDPFMDDSVLRDYAERLPDGATLRLLTTDKISRFNALLASAVRKWNGTYPERPAEVRVTRYGSTIHDRIIAIDRQTVWIVTQSLKDLATKAPATVTRFVEDLTPEKLAAYDDIWASSSSPSIS